MDLFAWAATAVQVRTVLFLFFTGEERKGAPVQHQVIEMQGLCALNSNFLAGYNLW